MIENRIKKETAMTKAVETERLATMLYQERKLKASRKDPKVMLSPRAYSQLILQRPIIKEHELKSIMESGLHKKLDPEHLEVVNRAIERANVASIPYWQQDFPFKLIKLNELNYEHWQLSDTMF